MTTIQRTTMIHRWEHLSFIHWPVDPADVAPLLPAPLEPDTFDGAAWIGLVPFVCRIRLPGTPFLPWASSFNELNARTYVRGPDGPAVWFFSCDAARLGAVLIARTSWRLPYVWAEMRTRRTADRIRYESRRRWPGARGADCIADLALGGALPEDERTERDRFLTERYRLYCPGRRGIATAVIDHEPWPLRRAQVLGVDETMFAAAGLPTPSGDPIALHSPGVETRFGARRPIASARTGRALATA